MTPEPSTTAEALPADAEERLLAAFLDEALERLARGEAVAAGRMMAGPPHLIERGEKLLHDARALLAAAGALRSQEELLRSDLQALTADEAVSAAADCGAAPPDPFPGEFRVRRRLGGGAFGTVWLADDLHLGRPVALKTIRPPDADRPAAFLLAQLREEARLLAAVRHRNVVQVHAWRSSAADHGASEFLVLQYVPGGSLADRVRREGPLSWRLAARYVADVAAGLLEVHGRGIVHRDVKPANVLWDPEADEAVLTDFGVSARLAAPGTVGGTPFFMPPEAFRGLVSPAQDVYGLAATLFWLVTGSFPFPGPSAEALAVQARRGLPDPDPRCTCLPARLERLIRKGLTADVGKRPSLAEFTVALRSSLNQLLADNMVQTPVPTPPAFLRLTVSRCGDRDAYVPVATSQPTAERLLRDLKQVPAEPARVDLFTGQRVRIEVESDEAGFVTVFNVGPTGNLNLLAPQHASRSSLAVAVTPGQTLHILDVQLLPPPGRERVFAVWTREPLPLRPDELRQFAEQGRSPTGPYQATRDLARVQESVQELPPDHWRSVVLELNHLASPDA